MKFKPNGYASRKFILAVILIIMVGIFHWFGKIADPQSALEFIKWIFITYCGADVGAKFVNGVKK